MTALMKNSYCVIFLSVAFFLLSAPFVFAQYDTLKTYYPDGGVKSILPRYESRAEGTAKFYFPSGRLQEERKYASGRVDGDVKRYWESGAVMEMYTIVNGKRDGQYMLFDEKENLVKELIYSEGYIVQEDTATIAEEEISVPEIAQNNEIINTEPVQKTIENNAAREIVSPTENYESIINRDTVLVDLTLADNPLLKKLSQVPEPVNGWGSISARLSYPFEALDKKIQGNVRVRALIHPEGYVIRSKVVGGLGAGCDEAADVAVYFTRFYPAAYGAKKYFTDLILNVEFKLP